MKKALLHQGKAKSVYEAENDHEVVIEYRDDASAFNGVKLASLQDKGRVNNLFNAYIMELLEKENVSTHFVRCLSDHESLMKKLEMIPVECVVRNYAAGGICKRLGLEKGLKFDTPVFEFFLKDDPLGDPMINESHILTFNWASQKEIDWMKAVTLQVNQILSDVFAKAGLLLVDYKLEFGRFNGKVLLGDEISPDGMRLWDSNTLESFDKDRFRQDMGDVIGHYKEVASRIGLSL
ncbi:phosphoribosylaminoimidazolesuccinocarboxamide synthase [Fangia hongkongensis]|uniref:phosphoribosylaminoimidazolesuccinocarboxamide synthase n=1 Tax=Fangia hongkongensis TaxID=270495 RepID=UPI000364309E|nr:phosphoribosylaminoimidazolesuccinocarboxamide synthase [Fangia hongkongensis]MBK2125943.1 phosphoribosylaminoimidazolesuccinocarboxamide synthase [Fangia hongkongensis]